MGEFSHIFALNLLKRIFGKFCLEKLWWILSKVRVDTITHDHDDTPHAILTILVVPAGK